MAKVKDIMRKSVITIDPEMTIDAAAKIMSNNRVGSVIILKNQKPVGIVTSEDVVSVVAQGISPKKYKVGNLTKRDFITASPDDHILDVTKIMIKKGIKRIPVINKGRLEGIITDKEILLTAPEMIDILSEKLKARVEKVVKPDTVISGICETCEDYDDDLHNVEGRWMCEECRE